MSINFNYKTVYSSHLPVLIKAVEKTDGDVLELGTGLFSTPVLHWLCNTNKRHLVSYDNDEEYFNIIKNYANDNHQIHLISNWNEIDIEVPWDVVFIDHPEDRRIKDALRVANFAKYIVIHDTGWWLKRKMAIYNKELFPFFKYRVDFRIDRRMQTTLLSNLVDLKDFSI